METVSLDELERQIRAAVQENDLAFIELAIEELEGRKSHGLKELVSECQNLLRRIPQVSEKRPIQNLKAKPIHKPTEEQAVAISLFQAGGSLKINAYAGAGKTSTLVMLASQSKKRGLYIAYNNAIVKEARQKLPKNVGCSTMHSLARKKVSPWMKGNDAKLNDKVTTLQVAEALQLQNVVVGEIFKLTRNSLAFLVLETVKKFAQSGAEAITREHVPEVGAMKTIPVRAKEPVTQKVVQKAEHLWKKMCDPGDCIPLGHDGYQKLWALRDGKIEADFILLDEAQDTNTVVLEALKKQDSQLVFVGDRYQQIYEWRGAVNAMESITTEGTTSLTRSFRFGPEIADYASNILELLEESTRIQGNEACTSRIGEVRPDAILARTNGNAIAAAIDALRSNLRPHLAGGNQEMLALLNGAYAIQNGRESHVPALFGLSSWRHVMEFSQSEEGIELRSFVKLVEKNGIPRLMEVFDNTVEENDSDIVISTAHKAKGREWRNVQLMDDFLLPPKAMEGTMRKREVRFDEAELRLYYVAVTRAKGGLSVPLEMRSKIPLTGF